MALTQTDTPPEKNDDEASDWNENQRLRSVVATDASSKATGRKRLESEHPLMFVRRSQLDDEKKAIFIRINNIAFSASANNETVRAIKRHVSSTDILSRTPSIPSTPRMSKPPRRRPRSPPTKMYLNILQRHRKTSFATMVDHYAQMDESYEREHAKKNTSLEDEVRQIDAFFNSLAAKPQRSEPKAPVHEEDKIAQLWKDLGFNVVKSKNRPSLFEITSTDVTPAKPGKMLTEIRKSKIYKSPMDKKEPSNLSLSTDTRTANSVSDTYINDNSDQRLPGSPKSKRRSDHGSKTIISWTVEDDNITSQRTESSKSPSKFRKYSEKFRGLFSKRKPAVTDKGSTSSRDNLNRDEKNTRTQRLEISQNSKGFSSSSESQQELSRHVRWSDSRQVAFDKESTSQKETPKASDSKNNRSCQIS